jgi:hypothetical protein
MSKISIFVATIISLAIQVHAANAGFVGMPLNLRAAVGAVEADMMSRSYQTDTDYFRAAPDLIIEC